MQSFHVWDYVVRGEWGDVVTHICPRCGERVGYIEHGDTARCKRCGLEIGHLGAALMTKKWKVK